MTSVSYSQPTTLERIPLLAHTIRDTIKATLKLTKKSTMEKEDMRKTPTILEEEDLKDTVGKLDSEEEYVEYYPSKRSSDDFSEKVNAPLANDENEFIDHEKINFYYYPSRGKENLFDPATGIPNHEIVQEMIVEDDLLSSPLCHLLALKMNLSHISKCWSIAVQIETPIGLMERHVEEDEEILPLYRYYMPLNCKMILKCAAKKYQFLENPSKYFLLDMVSLAEPVKMKYKLNTLHAHLQCNDQLNISAVGPLEFHHIISLPAKEAKEANDQQRQRRRSKNVSATLNTWTSELVTCDIVTGEKTVFNLKSYDLFLPSSDDKIRRKLNNLYSSNYSLSFSSSLVGGFPFCLIAVNSDNVKSQNSVHWFSANEESQRVTWSVSHRIARFGLKKLRANYQYHKQNCTNSRLCHSPSQSSLTPSITESTLSRSPDISPHSSTSYLPMNFNAVTIESAMHKNIPITHVGCHDYYRGRSQSVGAKGGVVNGKTVTSSARFQKHMSSSRSSTDEVEEQKVLLDYSIRGADGPKIVETASRHTLNSSSDCYEEGGWRSRSASTSYLGSPGANSFTATGSLRGALGSSQSIDKRPVKPLFSEYDTQNHVGQAWFLPEMSREDATESLERYVRVDGVFLVRESQRNPSAFVLSFVYNWKVHHIQILPYEEKGHSCISLDGGTTKFYDLLQLVKYYELNCGNLPTTLKHFNRGRVK